MSRLPGELRITADGASSAWEDAPMQFCGVLKACSDVQMKAADELERLQSVIDAVKDTGSAGRIAAHSSGSVQTYQVVASFNSLPEMQAFYNALVYLSKEASK